MTGFEIAAGFIIGVMTVLIVKLANSLTAERKQSKRKDNEHEAAFRELSYARKHIENVTARNRRSLIGVRIIARSNNDNALLIGKITGFAEITRANNPVPAVLEESTGKTLHTLGIVVPYSDELMTKLEGMSFKEQWDFMVAEGLGLRWE